MADEYVNQTNKNRENEDEWNLPINDKRDEIVQKVLKNQVCLIRCESGSGKSTQLPVTITLIMPYRLALLSC